LQGKSYNPHAFWEAVLKNNSDLSGVGHPPLGFYNRIAYRFRLRALKRAIKFAFPSGLPTNSKVFEAGFGVGFYLGYWRELGLTRVTGIDISDSAVNRAKRHFPENILRQQDLSEPFVDESESFDLVTAIDVLYHIVDDARWEAALVNLCELPKKGGFLFITDKFPDQGAFTAVAHVRRRSREMYEKALTGGGVAILWQGPVFALMDDPITKLSMPLFSRFLALQWRLVSKAIRLFGFSPILRDGVALLLGSTQYPAELALLKCLNTTPNLEIIVAQKQ